jgi:hypothetical protein
LIIAPAGKNNIRGTDTSHTYRYRNKSLKSLLIQSSLSYVNPKRIGSDFEIAVKST